MNKLSTVDMTIISKEALNTVGINDIVQGGGLIMATSERRS